MARKRSRKRSRKREPWWKKHKRKLEERGQKPHPGIPKGWLHYPKVGKPIIVKAAAVDGNDVVILPFKTPLHPAMTAALEKDLRWTIDDLLAHFDRDDEFQQQEKQVLAGATGYRLVHVIDLTDTSEGRYYRAADLETRAVKYTKLRVRGQGVPTEEECSRFNAILREAGLRQKDDEGNQEGYPANITALRNSRKPPCIGVHCTHGINRTGFMVSQFLCETTIQRQQQRQKDDEGQTEGEATEPNSKTQYTTTVVDSAVATFKEHRAPGIERQQYINALHRRFDGTRCVMRLHADDSTSIGSITNQAEEEQ
eukprot:Clim_evm4s253 gene=Clim_evmTU4s253